MKESPQACDDKTAANLNGKQQEQEAADLLEVCFHGKFSMCQANPLTLIPPRNWNFVPVQ
jgi:hypothetical protein